MNRVCMPGMVSNEEYVWMRGLMTQLRDCWKDNYRLGADKCKVPKATFRRWMAGEGFPGRTSKAAFIRACEISGIEVPPCSNR